MAKRNGHGRSVQDLILRIWTEQRTMREHQLATAASAGRMARDTLKLGKRLRQLERDVASHDMRLAALEAKAH